MNYLKHEVLAEVQVLNHVVLKAFEAERVELSDENDRSFEADDAQHFGEDPDVIILNRGCLFSLVIQFNQPKLPISGSFFKVVYFREVWFLRPLSLELID